MRWDDPRAKTPEGRYFEEIANNRQKIINQLSRTVNTASWAKSQLKILGDMAEDKGMDKWFIEQIRKIENGIEFFTS